MLSSHTTSTLRYPGATTTLFVSLYIILLAFFILLTALGRPDTSRSRSVLESLGAAFPVDRQSPVRGERGASAAMARLEALFRQQIERSDPQVAGGGRQIAVAVPDTALFRSGTPAFSARTPDFLLQLASVLRDEAGAREVNVEVLMSADDGELGRAQGVRLLAALESAGLDASRLSVTFTESMPEGRLTFRLTDRAAPGGPEVTG